MPVEDDGLPGLPPCLVWKLMQIADRMICLHFLHFLNIEPKIHTFSIFGSNAIRDQLFAIILQDFLL